MGNIIDDVKEVIRENADENLLEGTKVVRDFVSDVVDEFDQHKKQATAAVAIAATLAAGGAAAIDDDTDMEAAYEAIRTPNPIVMEISDPPADVEDEDKNKSTEAAEVKTEEASGIRQLISKVIITPLYMIGSGLMMIIKGIATLAQVPILGVIVRWAIIGAAILGTLAVALKLAFPNVPLSKILNKKCVSFVFIAVAIVSIVCEFASLVYPNLVMWIDLAQVIAGFGILVSIYVVFARAFSRKKHA